MQMLRDSLSPEHLAKFEAEEKARLNFIPVKKLEMTLPYGNRHERRAETKTAELQQRIKDLSK